MHIFRPRAKNRIDLPAGTVVAAGFKQGDILRAYKMADLLGAAPGLYESAGDVDAEIAAGRAE